MIIEATGARKAKEAAEVTRKSDMGVTTQHKLEETGKVARLEDSDQKDFVK